MIEYPSDYFEDEIRDGYYVNGFMKRCWAAQIEVLSDIDRVCKRHGIKWYADCGTLLGAVRHGGFIPWDDDLDICMFREDYTKFLSVAERELKKIYHGYIIRNFHNDDRYWEMISRVDNSLIMEFDKDHLDKFHGYPFRAGVDIFPLDYLSLDEEQEKQRTYLAQMIFTVSRRDDLMDLNEEVEDYIEAIEESCNVKFERNDQLRRQLYDFGERVFSLYTREETDKAVLMPYWLSNYSHVYPLELYEHTVMIPFETGYIPVPAAYNEVLKIEYGDYSKIVRTGSSHKYPYHDEHMALLNEEMGERSPFGKKVRKEDIGADNRVTGNNPRKALVDQIKGSIELFDEAHEEISKLVSAGESSDVINLLEQCQELAIQIGTLIEDSYGGGLGIIKCLEEYCELVYVLHEQIAENEAIIKDGEYTDRMSVQLQTQTDNVRSAADKDIIVKREVVFLPYKASNWCYMEYQWKCECDNPDTDVYVVPIPYYSKNALGVVLEEHYDIEAYQNYVHAVDYMSYDFETRHPDAIYIQYPYDNDNYTTIIAPDFYAASLRNHTDELVYIPCFVQEDFDISDERAYKSMIYYAVSPGVVYADRVIVQSQQMKEMYVKKLADYFGKEFEELWQSKIESRPEVYEPVLGRHNKKEIDMPEEWEKIIFNSDGTERKVIFYNIDIYNFEEHGEKTLDKIRHALKVFRDNSEIALVMYNDPMMEESLKEIDSKLCEEYRKIVEEYKAAGYGIYSSVKDHINIILELADAYYGDMDSLVQKFRNKKLPVMIQNVEVQGYV